MKFSIITPSYQRPQKLIRAVQSVLEQNYEKWEMIIVNDSPSFNYSTFEKFIEENKKKINNRIKYFMNKENMGVNFSRNFALNNVSQSSDYLTFLDDDDWLSKGALEELKINIEKHPNQEWFFSDRVTETGEKITKIPEYNKEYNYMWSHRIRKTIKNDSTNIIKTKLIQENNIRYSKYIKQAEELLFWHHINKYANMYALDLPTTISEGYLEDGLTHNKNSKLERIRQTFVLIKETRERKIFNLDFMVYIPFRILAILLI